MAEVLKINGNDYSKFVEMKGTNWSRNDLDGENTTRTKDGNLRREKITTKRKLTYKLMHMTQAELAQLDSDLSEATFSATYLDLHGVMTRTFYCSAFSATLDCVYSDGGEWSEATFNMIEV